MLIVDPGKCAACSMPYEICNANAPYSGHRCCSACRHPDVRTTGEERVRPTRPDPVGTSLAAVVDRYRDSAGLASSDAQRERIVEQSRRNNEAQREFMTGGGEDGA